ncbi:MAG: S8 family serine peptidase, partial [Clostridia bacterium]|nr:S8 family serine peptidase [Clostridia bacterium]
MNWKENNKKIVVSIVLVSVLLMGLLGNVIYSKAGESSSRLAAISRLQNLRNNTLSKTINININKEKNEIVRAIVVLEEEAVVTSVKGDISEYNSKLKSKEEDIIKEQENIIKKVEKITDNEVVNQSAFLVNSFSIDATSEEMEKIADIDGVESVYEASTFEIQMTDAVKIGKVDNVWEASESGYTGEGTVVAVIDTGVNYSHRDMVLDEGVKTKYTKEEWQEKIKLLGYGKYCSDKVPFGYDYVTGVDECLNTKSFHGYHVSGIAAANGGIEGVAKNAQVLGIKVLGNEGVGTTDDLVKGIEDSVKLGADIINMSLGYECSVKSDEDYLQEAINKASAEGVVCCIAACNNGTCASNGDNKNIIGTIDTATVGSPSVAKGSLSVASVDNISGDDLEE